MARIRELFSGAYSTLSSVSTAPDPHEAAFKFVTQQGSSGLDPRASYGGLGATPGAFAQHPAQRRDIGHHRSCRRCNRSHVNEVWRRDVLPQCQRLSINAIRSLPKVKTGLATRLQ